ncbi:MAG: hypothetical protein ACRD5I_03195, partial [Candidatus Acidiferrales bacterium]
MHLDRVLLAVVLLAAAGLIGAQAPPTQPQDERPARRSLVPDTFTNLQVLPKDIGKPELVRIMKGFSLTFDKNCSFCHVATDDLSEADFAADEKETKKKARELLRWIRETQKTP